MGRLRRGGDRDPLVRPEGEARRHRIPRLLHRDRRGRDPGHRVGRQGRSTSAAGRHRGRGGAEPDAVLRRVRRPGRRYRADPPARACRLSSCATPRRSWAISSSISARSAQGAGSALAVQAEVDHASRTAIRAHHSATHLLHEALRRRLGTHVAQKGSLNAPDRLRFDVSHPAPMTDADLAWVEAEVNDRVRDECRGRDPPDDAGGRGRRRRHGAVRREIRRGGARRRHGTRRPSGMGKRGESIRWSSAAAPMCGAPAISACSGSSPKAPSPPASAASRR